MEAPGTMEGVYCALEMYVGNCLYVGNPYLLRIESSMLEAEPERECDLKFLVPWEEVNVIGEFNAELVRELNMEVAEIGEMWAIPWGGLGSRRGGAGRFRYGVNPGGFRAFDNAFLWRLGPPAEHGSTL